MRVGQMMETEAAWEPEERELEKRSLSLEHMRKKYTWWPSGHEKEGSPEQGSRSGGQCNVEAGKGHESINVK